MFGGAQPWAADFQRGDVDGGGAKASDADLGAGAADGYWCRPEEFAAQALSTLTKKVVKYVLES